MCGYCDPNSYKQRIFYDEGTKAFYLEYETGQWSFYNDCFVKEDIEINYCPYCGRKLEKENK